MKFYVGIDLHSNNNYIGIIDGKKRKVFIKKLPNDIEEILKSLKPFKKLIQGIVVESTFNWYWLVDGLQAASYKVHLANTAGIQQYSGLKHVDDKTDALWLAEMLRLKILPEGYIFSKKERALRDLLRKRMQLVQHRTAFLLSIKGMINNWSAINISRKDLQKLDSKGIKFYLKDQDQIQSAESLKEVTSSINVQIKLIEKEVIKKVKLKKGFKKLLTVPGIGDILGMTIMLETGPVGRFEKVGDYTSYCRCVTAKKKSNGKNKGTGNKKNGNRYLAWAYIEAANFMVRFCPLARSWHQKKAAKGGPVLATKALSSKIARACYYIMRDNVPYNPIQLFHQPKKGVSGNR
jgi:transposase